MSESFKGGQEATLFPIYKNIAEDQATSIFFAVFELVYPFRAALLTTIDQKAYKSGHDFNCILRPSIGGRLTAKDIPDAIVTLDQKTKWQALVEVKIGAAQLNQAQLVRYLNRAIDEKVDCLVTISNEMCMTPCQPPLRLKPAEKRLRKIPHYHWSWRFIEFIAKKILSSGSLNDLEYSLLSQFIALLTNESGIHGYKSMPACWPKFVDTLRDGGHPKEEDVEDIIAGWFQESADLSIILSEIFDTDAEYVHEHKSIELRKDAAEKLMSERCDLEARFKIKNGKEVLVTVDIDKRCVKFETSHQPTKKVKSSHKQIERFLDGFRDTDKHGEWGDHSDVRLFAKWKRQQKSTDASMSDAMIDVEEDTLKSSKLILSDKELREIIVQYTPSGAAKSFRSSKKIIEFLEDQFRFFAETYI